MISEHTFAGWMGVFEQRLGKPLDELAFGAYFAALRDKFRDDAEFSAAAQRVFEKHAWNTWPAPIEFESAAADLRRIPDAEIKQTYAQYIEPARQLAASPYQLEGLKQFSQDWRQELSHCSPEAVKAEQTAAKRRPNDGREWASLPGVPGPKVARGSDSRVGGPPPGPSIDAIAAGGAAA